MEEFDDKMKQLITLFREWYCNSDYIQCLEELRQILDTLHKKYPNVDIKSIISDYINTED